MTSRSPLALALALLLAVPPATSLATTFVTTSLRELATRADVIVRVRVTTSESRWLDEQQPSRIVTFHDARVLEVLRGELADAEARARALLVGVPGGAVGAIAQRVPDAPALEIGREYVLLLGRADGPGGARGIAGLRYGVVPAGPTLQPLDQLRLEDALPVLRGPPSPPIPSGSAR